MVKRRKDKEKVEEETEGTPPDSEDPSTSDDGDAAEDSRDSDPPAASSDEDESEDGDESEDESEDEDEPSADMELAARSALAEGATDEDEEEDEEEEQEAAHLGIQKYVLASYFAFGMLFAYVLGRLLHSIWAYLANRDWFSQALPEMAAVLDESKLTYATVFSGVASLVLVIRLYKREKTRTWIYDVAGELAKVKWPSKKDVTNSTITVLATAIVATTYLALLDRFWGFVTDLVYGTGT